MNTAQQMKLTTDDKAFLTDCIRSGGGEDLLWSFNFQSEYFIADKLVGLGLLSDDGETFSVTDAGREAVRS